MKTNNAVSRLIKERIAEFGITPAELVRRMGYSNVNKGMRRLDQIENGDIQCAVEIREFLAAGLELDSELISHKINEGIEEIKGEQERAYLKDFKPHAIILTTRTIPSPIFVAAMCRSDRLMRIDFKEGSSPVTYSYQAKQKLPEGIPAFGKTTGFIVNYSPYHAVAFDRCGHPTRQLNEAVRLGQAHLNVSRHVFPPELIKI